MRAKRHIPNLVTFLRLILAVPVFIAAVFGLWTLGFWLLLIALVTDYLDGWLARKLNASTEFGKQLDRYTDAALAAASGFGIIIAGFAGWYWAVPIGILGIVLEFADIKRTKNSKTTKILNVTPTIMLFVIWILAVWAYGAMAYGWSWLYLPATLLALVIMGLFKRHRIIYWINRD